MEAVMTTDSPIDSPPVDCVGVICFRGDDVLLIKRGTAPRKGEWSIPGGRIEAGESERDAALRELFEETGIMAALETKVAVIDARFENFNYRLHDYAARWISGEPQFGDDAADARFVAPHELDGLGMWPKTREVIETARNSLKTAKLL
jgi:8-oxo-dGTP diphosphatase